MGLAEELISTLPRLRAVPAAELLAQLIDWDEFWKREHVEEDWIAWPMIPAGRQIALYAPAKSGKSLVVLAVVAAVATGRPILGQRNDRGPHHVLYLDYEMTESDLHERLETLGYGPDDDLSHLHYALLPSLPALNTDQGCKALRNLAEIAQAEVVVIDTMGRAVTGEENSADSYREFARLTGLLLKADGRAVLRTDHAGKNADAGQRGSSAKNDDVDVVLRIDPHEGGWTLRRTHTRIAWVPEKVVLRREAYGEDDPLRITVAPESERTYVPGTGELVAELRVAGIDLSMTRRQAADAARDAGMKVSNKRLGDALRWMRAEEPTFGIHPAVAAVEDAMNDARNARKTSGTKPGTKIFDPLTGPAGDQHETSSSTSGDQAGDQGDQGPRANGDQGWSLVEDHPGPSPRSERLEFDPRDDVL